MRAGGKSQDLALFPLRSLYADSNMCPDVPGETRAGWPGCGLWEVWGMNLLSSPVSRTLCACAETMLSAVLEIPKASAPSPIGFLMGILVRGQSPVGRQLSSSLQSKPFSSPPAIHTYANTCTHIMHHNVSEANFKWYRLKLQHRNEVSGLPLQQLCVTPRSPLQRVP